jgi:hypothetical protein
MSTKQRQEINNQLVQQLYELINKYPDMRFSQALLNFGFVRDTNLQDGRVWIDEYNVEPEHILARVSDTLEKMKL